jgi:hypothetical protein
MSYQRIDDYTVIRAPIVWDVNCHSTFAIDVQSKIDAGYQPYGKPILTPEPVVGFSTPQIVGYQTMVKYATTSNASSPKLIPDHSRLAGA